MALVNETKLETMTEEAARSIITPPHDFATDIAYWRAQTPTARLEAMERMRQLIYGYDPATARMEKVLTVGHLHDQDD